MTPGSSGQQRTLTSRTAPLTPDAEQRARNEEAKIVEEARMAEFLGLSQPAPQVPSQPALQAPAQSSAQAFSQAAQKLLFPPTVSPSGTGVAAFRNPEEPIYKFPARVRQIELDQNTEDRAEATVAMAMALTNPRYVRLPAHVREADKEAMQALIDQKFRKVKTFDEENPSVQDFGKSIMNSYHKRQSFVEALRGQVALIDNTFKKYGNDNDSAANELVPKLMGMLKMYNSALAGTSDALSNTEVERLSPELNPYLFDPKKALLVGGKVVGSDIKKFKSKLEDLHDILLNESNSAWNTMAAMSSPEYASKVLGYEHKRHFTENVVPRFADKIPERVAIGALDYAGYIKQRQALFEQELPQAESAKTQILRSNLPPQEKYRLLKGLRDTFNARTGRDLDVPEEFLVPKDK